MDKYLDEADAKRYRELMCSDTALSLLETDDSRELHALMDKSLAKQIEIYGEPEHTPFGGKCRRCGKEFTNPIPEVTVPEGDPEIACAEWCADCNRYAMNIIRRWATAYKASPHELHDPLRERR